MSCIHGNSYKALLLEELMARVGVVNGFFIDKDGNANRGFLSRLAYDQAGYLQLGENVDNADYVDFRPIDEDGFEILYVGGHSLVPADRLINS